MSVASAGETPCFDELPDEVVLMIFALLDTKTLLTAVPGVCRRWRALCGDTPRVRLNLRFLPQGANLHQHGGDAVGAALLTPVLARFNRIVRVDFWSFDEALLVEVATRLPDLETVSRGTHGAPLALRCYDGVCPFWSADALPFIFRYRQRTTHRRRNDRNRSAHLKETTGKDHITIVFDAGANIALAKTKLASPQENSLLLLRWTFSTLTGFVVTEPRVGAKVLQFASEGARPTLWSVPLTWPLSTLVRCGLVSNDGILYLRINDTLAT